MTRSGSFTAVPGRGSMAMGVVALGAALTAVPAARHLGGPAWLWVWLLAAVVAGLIGSLALVRKARAEGVSLRSGVGRKFMLSLLPPMLAGLALTVACLRAEEPGLLPGLWLLLYGTGAVTAGAFSVRPVPLMGACFMALGLVALFVPFAVAHGLLGGGFGGLHLVFGYLIAKHHGG